MEMPETPEVETDKLREAVQEELAREGGSFLRRIALTTAVLAAIAAIAALKAGSTANEALVLKTEAARLQAEASDQWAYYQAKGIKLAVAQATEAPWQAQGKRPPADLLEREQRYAADQEEIKAKAEELEAESGHHMRRHGVLARAVTLFQIAIAVGAVAVLVRRKPFWFVSLAFGAAGAGFLVQGLLT